MYMCVFVSMLFRLFCTGPSCLQKMLSQDTACRQINMKSLKAWSIYNNCCWTCYLIRLHWPRMKLSFCGLLIRLSHCAYTFCCCGLSTVSNITEGLCWQVLQHNSSMWTCYTTREKETVELVDVALPAGLPKLSPFSSPNSGHVDWEMMWLSLSARKSQLRRNLMLCILPRSPPSAGPNGVTRVQIGLRDVEHLNTETMQSSDLWKLSS